MITNNPSVLDINWPIPNVLAFSTTRQSPFTQKHSNYRCQTNETSCFDSFNLGLHVNDNTKNVLHNRQQLLTLLPKNSQVQWLEQVHGNNVIDVTKHQVEPYIADAVITREKGIALAIMTADCLPILLSSRDGTEVAAIHGGWRPIAANIIEKTLELMHSPTDQIIAWLGPCISHLAFEVGQEVKDEFVQISRHFSSAFKPLNKLHQQAKYLADLPHIATLQLKDHGVNHIINSGECTYMNAHKFYSYRRDMSTGRMASIITRF